MQFDEQHRQALAAQTGVSLANGRRVLDGVTGELGTIVDSVAGQRLINATIATTTLGQPQEMTRRQTEMFEQYQVKLDSGELVTRERAQLVPQQGTGHIDLENFI